MVRGIVCLVFIALAAAFPFVVALFVDRLLDGPPRSARRAPSNNDPFAAAERCRACGAWQARHLIRDVCWQCHAPIERSAEAAPTDEAS